LLDFFWHDLCDWYIEAAKTRLQGVPSPARQGCQEVLANVLEQTLRLLHPVCPFITEEIWQQLPHDGETILRAGGPEAPANRDQEALDDCKVLQDLVGALRNLRAERKVDAAKVVGVLLKCSDPRAEAVLRGQQPVLEMLTRTRVQALGPEI